MTKKTKPEANGLASLEQAIGHTFAQRDLLELALTHRSLAFEAGNNGDPSADNEQLEFLGDAVVGLMVADALLQHFPACAEGTLTRLRAMLVSRKHLGEVGLRLGLGEYLRLGRGEEQSGGRKKPVLLANATEALIAALYRDGGVDAAREFVEREIMAPRMEELHAAVVAGEAFGSAAGDFKTALQELLQSKPDTTARAQYVVLEDRGHAHAERFYVELRVEVQDGPITTHGEGATKKAAQQRAAEAAYTLLKQQAGRAE
ncbi:MAG: ribonuclease III [Acidobacteria bacterium]|nr:ribonuclease III [Acidobacteriota bacterium]